MSSHDQAEADERWFRGIDEEEPEDDAEEPEPVVVVERLRVVLGKKVSGKHRTYVPLERAIEEAAEYIESQREEIERLTVECETHCRNSDAAIDFLFEAEAQLAIAREALEDLRDCFHEDSDAYSHITAALTKLQQPICNTPSDTDESEA